MKQEYLRRQFLQKMAVVGAAASFSMASPVIVRASQTTQKQSEGYFSLGQRKNHWWLIEPSGQPFFSMGLNHIDPASMRYPENIHLWREKYGGNNLRWIRESVAPNLKAWGFNTVGWVQEVTVRKWQHSRPFTREEFQALEMPYCHLLPFMESHQWEKHTVHFDFKSDDWKEWCDYVARSHCAELSNDPNLIGYFYSDCPCWIHDRPDNHWRGPIFDPDRLKTESGRKELKELASLYYQTTHDAIRRYDPHHLILGDRYEANAPIAMEVIDAAKPFVDVFSFQDFRSPVEHLEMWHKKTGKPVLLADGAGVDWKSKEFYRPNNGEWYAKTLAGLHMNPGCVGVHLCGAYQRNKSRRRGLLDEFENPDEKQISIIRSANDKVNTWMAQSFEPKQSKQKATEQDNQPNK